MFDNDIFNKYDLLIPSKFEGGYLVIALYQKIKRGELNEIFTTNDIRITLEEVSSYWRESLPQSERVIKNLLHYFLRAVPNEYGKYRLTDHGTRLVELVSHKLNNPYKNFPLKESFDKYFTLRFKDIQSVTDLEFKFGSGFVAGHKQIINDHLESLEDELNDAYSKLNDILHSNELDATALVKKFVGIFRQFGERAEDISSAIASKDKFLRSLRERVDGFYTAVMNYRQPVTETEEQELERLREDWKKATVIHKQIENFFNNVDEKIGSVRRQILNASDKLSELHENFASRSNFRLNIKRLLGLALSHASYNRDGLELNATFPRKEIFQEKAQLFYPEYYLFDLPTLNKIVEIPRDLQYELAKKTEIENEIKSQEIINEWVSEIKMRITKTPINIKNLMDEIAEKESDPMIAMYVAVEITQYVSEAQGMSLEIKKELQLLKSKDMHIWKMNLQNKE